MATTAARKGNGPAFPAAFHELDRVRLNRSLSTEGKALVSGLIGTVILCHGAEAFEVEFDGIDDFFQILGTDLEKI